MDFVRIVIYYSLNFKVKNGYFERTPLSSSLCKENLHLLRTFSPANQMWIRPELPNIYIINFPLFCIFRKTNIYLYYYFNIKNISILKPVFISPSLAQDIT